MTRLLIRLFVFVAVLFSGAGISFASDCASDPNECTPKILFEDAMEAKTDGGQNSDLLDSFQLLGCNGVAPLFGRRINLSFSKCVSNWAALSPIASLSLPVQYKYATPFADY